MKFTILGCGASAGVPQLGCDCDICTNPHPRNVRTRSSALLQTNDQKNILIDVGPDFRQQALANNIKKIDAVYITHTHADHIDGFNELRPYSFKNKAKIPLYIRAADFERLKTRFDYIFDPDPEYPGSPPANFDVKIIEPYQTINICGIEVTPISLKHDKEGVAGFHTDKITYAPDCCGFTKESFDLVKNTEYLFLDALWPMEKMIHHYNLPKAIKVATELKAQNVYFTHLTHYMDYEVHNHDLPENFQLCYDGLNISL